MPWRLGMLVLSALVLAVGCTSSQPRVVLYCAQDREFAEGLLADFTKQHGIRVDPKFDTEADKSVSLYNALVQEKDRPRCDVFWNNEILSTLRLQRLGMLAPYDSPAAKPFPDIARASDHTWHAFGARARVLLVNTNLVPEAERPKSLLELTDPKWKGKVAIAKPQFGTTATHAACLFEVLGKDEAKAYYTGLRDNGIQIVPGNKQSAEGVGEGRFAVGMTDTDDAMGEINAGKPVVMIFPDRDGSPDNPNWGTLFIPNSVSIIKGGPNPEAARKLVDFLLSAEVEKRMAEGGGYQIPLNPEVKADLPNQIERPQGSGGTVKPMVVDFGAAVELWDEVQTFLRNEFARP